jgi:hypothetical protein
MSCINRREFLKNSFRFSLAGGLVAIGFSLGGRKSGYDNLSEICKKPSPCQNCGRFNGCTLPRALAEMQMQKSASDSLYIPK